MPNLRTGLLEEQLRSPCITELAVFGAFSGLLMRARTQHVIIDTAPTGHTLLLLDATGRRCAATGTVPGAWSRR